MRRFMMVILQLRRIFVSAETVGRIQFWQLGGQVCLRPYYYLGSGVGTGKGGDGSFNP